MDISRSRFPVEVVKIIQLIADSHFVAFDLEFSGIAGRRKDGKKPTLQEVYKDIKLAAEQYQVLQVGLTVVHEDITTGRYILHPYNFNINPIPASEKLQFDRVWSFQSGAVDFLLRNGFDFDLPYHHGVPYLSHKDEREVRAAWLSRDLARASLNDMPIMEEDAVLINHVRASIEEWQQEPAVTRETYLNIPNTSEGKVRYLAPSQTLNRYQIRLVHQIVRNEYPTLKTTGKGHFIQIIPFDETRAIQFRWLFDAVSGGDITKMPLEYFANAPPSDSNQSDREEGTLEESVDRLQHRLSSRRRVLIGHNCFTDLVYLYSCFVGQLPEKVEEFQEVIHDMFPAVVDTKFMASFGRGWHSTSLQEVDLELNTEGAGMPLIDIPLDFDRYSVGQRLHEAGFDSLLTAKIAIKLSAKLEKEGNFPAHHTEEGSLTTDDDVSEHYGTVPKSIADAEAQDLASTIKNVLSTPMTVIENFFRSNLASTGQQFEGNSQDTGIGGQLEDLMVSRDKVEDEQDKPDEHDRTESGPQEDAHLMVGGRVPLTKALKEKPLTTGEISQQIEKGELMPRWEGGRGFWQYFGNKLQVNSAEEGICYL